MPHHNCVSSLSLNFQWSLSIIIIIINIIIIAIIVIIIVWVSALVIRVVDVRLVLLVRLRAPNITSVGPEGPNMSQFIVFDSSSPVSLAVVNEYVGHRRLRELLVASSLVS